MNLVDWILVAVIIAVLGIVCRYIYKSRKKGKACIGCPSCGNCSGCKK